MSATPTATAQALLDAEGGIDEIGAALARHFARLIGTAGVQSVLDRSIELASTRHPWLGGPRTDAPRTGWSLREPFARRTEPDGVAGLADLLSTFIGLLGRFIGEELVARALHELWPDAFPVTTKERS